MNKSVNNNIGVIAALPLESKFLENKLGKHNLSKFGERLVIRTTGISSCKTKIAALELISNGAKALISWGTAGSLSSYIPPGSIVIPDYIENSESNTIKADKELIDKFMKYFNKKQKSKIHHGNIVHVDKIIGTKSQKREISEMHKKAAAIDMESYIIADIAHKYNIPFIAIRIIVDSMNIEIPKSVSNAMNIDGNINYPKLIGNLLLHREDIPKLWELSYCYNKAKASFKHASNAIVK